MSEQNLTQRTLTDLQVENEKGRNEVNGARKNVFVEPEISAPVDVLEATTFFQAATSGATN